MLPTAAASPNSSARGLGVGRPQKKGAGPCSLAPFWGYRVHEAMPLSERQRVAPAARQQRQLQQNKQWPSAEPPDGASSFWILSTKNVASSGDGRRTWERSNARRMALL